ncbi:transcriptional regulator [Streptomyces abyssalis]|uniref:Transcriptional regulator n=1 Tax=Streptomyces abyssalis TaxID=933944 RepID=A0A1E7JQ14_9ACTN|nr:GntR family transcriptional regulator [Streptomyces abyssalis]OEU90350.1 transcriptional regulator [Streptomyces abyssalis]OEU95087.1 transcriptional regulator [Streptomyces abyssalis]
MAKAYELIADDFRRPIRAGELKPGDKLPTEAKLVERYRKGLPTIRQALGQLEAEGLVEKKHGRGTFVRMPRKLVSRSNERHQWEKDRAREPETQRLQTGSTEHDTGLTVDDLVFHAKYEQVPADGDLATAFGVPEGTDMLRRTYRTRYSAEPAPFTLVTSYLVRDMVAKNPDLLDETNEPWPGGTQNQLFTVGIELDHIEERITARPPSAEEAEELELPPGTAVLVLRKFSYGTEDRLVEMSDVILPGDRTQMTFVTPLDRW